MSNSQPTQISKLIIDGRAVYYRGDTLALNANDQSRSTSNVWWSPDGHHDYDSKCAACYLGHGHTLAYHNAELGN
jgi:hypothetical protein